MLTTSLTVRRHSCRSIPRSTNPPPHYPLGSSSSNSFPHNPLSNPHLLNPVVSILYRNMRGGVAGSFFEPSIWISSIHPLFSSYISHNVLGPPTTRSSCGINSLRTLSTATGVYTVYPPLPLSSSSSKSQSVRSHTSASPGPIGCRLFSDRQLVFGGKTIFQNRGAGDRNSTGMSEPS